MIATQARSRIRGNHAHADAPARIHTFAHGDDFADQLMAKDGWRLNHLGVIAALPDFQVCAISERQANAHQDFVSRQGGDINLFNAKILAAIEHSRGHL